VIARRLRVPLCRVAPVVLAAVASSSCLVMSLQPVYDDQSMVFDEQLIGHWENAEDGTSVLIDRAEWRSYKVTYTDPFTTYVFHGNLTSVDGIRFLDLMQQDGSDAGPYLIAAHAIYRIALTDDRLTAAALDYGWLTRAIEDNRAGHLAAAMDGRRNAVITARTPEVRAWLAGAPADAYAAPMTFTRTG
jgi:hypothetical protein